LPVLAAAGGGRIVNIGSISGQVGGVGAHPAYGASKAGVHALTKTYALEGARVGVLCNAVAPGLLAGGMVRKFSDTQREKLARAKAPQRRHHDGDHACHSLSRGSRKYLRDRSDSPG
jgi:NAD(P)-dependent dehydrogenase (short-subunit alcohol dehydrogenase family)